MKFPRSEKGQGAVQDLALVAGLLFFAAIAFMLLLPSLRQGATRLFNPPHTSSGGGGSDDAVQYIADDFSDLTLPITLNITNMEYQVDVKINGTHAWDRHSKEATNAIRCINNNGTYRILSEKSSRNLHLICVDPKTQAVYDVIITRIIKGTTATSSLVTAYSVLIGNADQYVQRIIETGRAIIVGLQFLPGEVFFTPL